MRSAQNAKRFLWPCVLVLAVAMLCARAFYGFDRTDESYYLATAFDRSLRGLDMSGVYGVFPFSTLLLWPLIAAYRCAVGSMEGGLLFMRLSYCLCSGLTAWAVFRSLKRHVKEWIAGLCAVACAAYSPLAIGTFSYNTMFILFTIMTLCALSGVPKKSRLLLAGLLAGCAIVSYPSAVVLLPLFLYAAFLQTKETGTGRMQRTLWAFYGVAAVGMITLLSFAATPMDALLDTAQQVLNEPDHWQDDKIAMLHGYIYGILTTFGLPAVFLYFCLFCYACVKRLAPGKEPPDEAYRTAVCWGLLVAVALSIAHWLRSPLPDIVKINLLLYLFAPASPVLWVLSDEKPRGPVLLWVFGLLTSLIVHFTTNNGFYLSAWPLMFCSLMSVLYAARLFSPRGRALKACAALALVCFAGLMLAFRITTVYRDAPLPQLNTKIETGVAKGLYTTKERAQAYETLQKSLSGIKPQLRGKKLLVIPLEPWLYPETETLIAGPHAWRVTADDTRLEGYYERYPQLLPDWVLMLPGTEAALKDGSALQELLKGYDYSNDPNYGTLYRRNATAVEGS